MKRNNLPVRALLSLALWSLCGCLANAQNQEKEEEAAKQPPFSVGVESTLTSKFMWRGQRLTDGWCFQPSGTFSVKGLSFNVWGNVDLQAVNEGDSLFLRQNPEADGLGSGLRGRMSEVDLTVTYAREARGVAFEGGMIAYLLPYTAVIDPGTVEIYGGLSFPTIPLSPGATLYADIDEARKYQGVGLYLALQAGHSFAVSGSRVESIDLAASLGVTNADYASYWYESEVGSGFHDVGLTAEIPIRIGKGWSSTFLVGYSSLLGKYRDHQYVNLRDSYLGYADDPRSYADTVWGGVRFAFEQ